MTHHRSRDPCHGLTAGVFHRNFVAFGHTDGGGNQVFSLPVPADLNLQIIAVDDSGYFVAEAFDNPQEYLGRAIEIAGKELTPTVATASFQHATGTTTGFAPHRTSGPCHKTVVHPLCGEECARRQKRQVRSSREQPFRDMCDLDLVAARIDHQPLGVTGQLLDAVLDHVTVAAEQLHRLHRDLGGRT